MWIGKATVWRLLLVGFLLSLVSPRMAIAQSDNVPRLGEIEDYVPVDDESASAAGEPDSDRSPGTLIASITIFVLAVIVGFEVITKVPPTLHTPLMSGSNAISGITLVGALLAAGARQADFAALLGTVAVILASINVVGGFMVTDRMLSMFRRK